MAEDFQEEEVWAMMKVRSDGSHSKSKVRRSSSSAWRFGAAIPRSSGGGNPTQQSSAPVNIPDWSKILRKNPDKKLWDDARNDEDGGGRENRQQSQTNDDDDDDDDDMLPPHEYLARRLASTQIASFSMCEGVGRTLKGRDLSNLRNAILTKTGFLE